MGLRGPLPKLSVVIAGKRKAADLPEPPSDLGPAGLQEWKRVTDELSTTGFIAEVTLGLLEDLARAVDDAAKFREVWKREGLTVMGQGRPFPHPMVGAERDARKTANDLRRELGLTPASAGRVPKPSKPKGDGKLAEFGRR